jgi:hypothetical protein
VQNKYLVRKFPYFAHLKYLIATINCSSCSVSGLASPYWSLIITFKNEI